MVTWQGFWPHGGVSEELHPAGGKSYGFSYSAALHWASSLPIFQLDKVSFFLFFCWEVKSGLRIDGVDTIGYSQ